MDEYFLQFLWKFQKFQTLPLTLTNGQGLTVFHPGHQNHHSGPDFQESKIKIDDMIWSGSVEVHFRSSDWARHGHGEDKAYQNVILHVVWQHDQEVIENGEPLPTLVLKDFVDLHLEQAYRNYINQPTPILCNRSLPNIGSIQISSMIDRSVAARLQEKSKAVQAVLETTGGDWEETSYRILARNFGFKVNSEPFETLARSLPYKILRKHTGQEQSVYALIFGMAGLLETSDDAYQQSLIREFEYLRQKYQLTPVLMKHHWRFAKMRPANFPTVRLAQLAALLHQNPQLFSRIISVNDLSAAIQLVQLPPASYWQKHFDFGKPSNHLIKIGKTSVINVIINSVVPVLTAYSKYLDDVSLLEKAYTLLESMPAEDNHILQIWKKNNIIPENAAESQALLYQYHAYCTKKKCLRCNIGLSILNSAE